MAQTTRHLSAVMLTDIVGYSALTQRDESGALRLLEEHREIVRPLLRVHAGREVKTIGDAFLVEFPNALDAIRCALAIQKSLHERNAKAQGPRIELRVGLHVGDVEEQDGDIYGDAVNIVSRVEPMAEPGGICVSGDVYNQVRNKVELTLEPLGSPSLKNIEFPVALYRVELPWLVTSLVRRTPWVSRPKEQELLRQAVDQATKGKGSAIVLVGESGVGKTRLADETIRAAEKSGFRVLRGRAFPGELITPYSHWAEMVREFFRDTPGPLAYKLAGPAAGELTRLVPELADRLGAAPTDPELDADAARARFYGAISQFFFGLSEHDPLLLFFDDLQWADMASLRLLEFALRSVGGHRLLILGTSQETEGQEGTALFEIFRYLRRNDLLTTVPIHRLDRAGVGAMIERTFGESAVSEEFRALVHDRTGGNPFFVEEVLRSLVEDGAIYRTPEGRWDRKTIDEIGIPKTIREVVKQRVGRLDDATQATLRVASVLGVEFPADLLKEVAALDEERLIEQLERLVRAGLLTESKSSKSLLSFTFADPQLRDVLYGDVLSLRRVRYHRKAAEVLETLAGSHPEEFAGELAHHYREGHDAGKALRYALLAAEQWASVYAFDEAERHYRMALELVEESPDDRVRARILAGLGRSYQALGRLDRVAPEWEGAIRLYEQVGEFREAGRLCQLLADLLRLHEELEPRSGHRVDDLLEKGRGLLERVPPSRELALLYDLMTTRLSEKDRPSEARAMAERGIEVARSIGDRDAEMAIEGSLYLVLPITQGARALQVLRDGERYFSERVATAPDQLEFVRLNLVVESLLLAGNLPEALRWADLAIEGARKARNRDWESLAHLRKSFALGWAGEIQRAQAELETARELRGVTADSHDSRVERNQGELALLREDPETAAKHFARAGIDPTRASTTRVMVLDLVQLERARNNLGEAIRLLREALAREKVPLAELTAAGAIDYILARAALIETLLQTPRETHPQEEIDRLSRELHELATALGSPLGCGSDLRAQAELLLRDGRNDEAVTRFEEALDWFRKCGNVLQIAQTLRRLEVARRTAGQDGPAEAARTESEELFRRLKGATS